MRRHFSNSLIYSFLIGALSIFLVSCAGTPKKFLAIDASLVKQGSTQTEVTELLGQPQAKRTNPEGQQEWYYYNVEHRFWQRIPLLGRHLGKDKVEALQIIFAQDRVAKVVYYLPNDAR